MSRKLLCCSHPMSEHHLPSKQKKMFYGWWIVAASFFISLYIGGVVFYGFTAFLEPIANETGWSFTQVSLAASLRALMMGLLAPLIGILVDRWGPRRLIFSGLVIIMVGLFLLSDATSLGMFYGAFALIALGMSASTLTVLMTAMANWFRRKIGIASGIAICGFGFSGLLIPVIVKLIEVYEWRMTVSILALGILVILPLSLLFRHKPEEYGYSPDGQVEEPATYDNGPRLSQAVEVEVKVKQALKSGTFWRLALSFTCHMTVISATITHIMPYLSSIGTGKSISSLVAAAIPLVSISGRLGLGWLGDKVDRKLVATGAFAMMGFGLLCFGYASTAGTWLLVPFLVLFGVGYGGSNALRPSLGREYFGRTNFGTIFGLIIGMGALGETIGPALAGWVYDNWDSYQGIWFVFAGLAAVALISMLTVPPVSKGEEEDKMMA